MSLTDKSTKLPAAGMDGGRERNRFEMRLTREDRLLMGRLSHRTGERDMAKVVRQALRCMEKQVPGVPK